MGLDAYANATWGLRVTFGELRKTFVKNRVWIGPKTLDRSHDYDPKTGKSNYETEIKISSELEHWNIESLDPESPICDDELDLCDVDSSVECIIVLESQSTGSHRSGASVERISVTPNPKNFRAFEADMKKLGLWQEKRFGLWLRLDMSY